MLFRATWNHCLSAALAIAALLGGAGCADGPAIATPAAPAPTAGSAAGGANPGKTLLIGAVVPLSGPQALLGQSLQRGLEMGAAEVNAAGGVNGRLVSVGVLDSQGDLTEGTKAVQKWRERGAPVILLSDNNLAAFLAEDIAKYPELFGFMCDFVSVPTITPNNGIRVYLNGDQEARAITGYIEAAGLKRVAMLHLKGYAYQGTARYLDFILQGDQRTTYTDSYAVTDRDFRVFADAMRRMDSQVLVLIGLGREYPALLAAFAYANWNGPVFGYLNQGNFGGLTGLSGLAAGAYYPVPEFALNPRATPAGAAFADKFRAQYGADPDLPAAYAHDNVLALAAAAKEASSFQSLRIRDGFLALKTFTGAVGTYTIKHDGDTEMPLVLVTADGKPAPQPEKAPDAAPAPAPATPRETLIDSGLHDVIRGTPIGGGTSAPAPTPTPTTPAPSLYPPDGAVP